VIERTDGIMTDRNSDQLNNALDRAEDILADNALQLAEMRQRLTQLESYTKTNIDAMLDGIDRLIQHSEQNDDQITRINAAIDRTNGILERYITQMSIEKTYARGKLDDLESRVEQRLTSLESKLDEMERNSPN
jgi:chromosome segregation ATPase